MVRIKPFKGLRPPKGLVTRVVSRPYDVLSSEEAREEAENNEMSMYHIIKPEIDFEVGTDEHEPKVYQKAVDNFEMFQEKGWLVSDSEDHYYIYAQTMAGRTQYGFVLTANVDDYLSGKIKKHELTRKDKEEDRMKHVRNSDANIGPVFLAFRDNERLEEILKTETSKTPEYDFVTEDNVGHHFWKIDDKATIAEITSIFKEIPALYIADGHHRSAAAALVGHEKALANPHHTGDEEYNFFLAVAFPASHLKIMDYNRLVRDLNGNTPAQVLEKLEENFVVQPKGAEVYRPNKLHNFSVYMDKQWYSLTAKEGTYNDDDPIGVLDVTISSDLILHNILGIKDLRTDKRIDFVGGIRGLEELQKRVDSGEMAFALALYPVSMEQLMRISDTNNIMPPKTTWFEPKLRTGMVIHKLETK